MFRDYFTARQLVALSTFSDLVGVTHDRICADGVNAGLSDGQHIFEEGGISSRAYADAVSTYLAFAVDKAANLWSSLTSWMSDRGALRETFARQAIPMVWDFAETNPFSGSGGNFEQFISRIADSVSFFVAGPVSEVWQQDASRGTVHASAPVCATDPPYYDNIGYADLSDYFYVWLRRSLSGIYDELFVTMLVPKAEELIATPYRFDGDKQKAKSFFEKGMLRAFSRINSIHNSDYPLTVYYAFKQAESDEESENGIVSIASTGWETMLEALLKSNFGIAGTWPLRTESPGRSTAQDANALASSIVLACRKRPENAPTVTRRGFLQELKSELPKALRTLQRENIAPVDLAQSAIGPGMAVFSRYAKVLEADGSAMPVRMALALINQVLDEVLAEREGEFDPETRWTVAWFQQFGIKEGPFGEAETLSKAKVISVGGLQEAGILTAQGGKVKLIPREQLPKDWDPAKDARLTVWEIAQHMIRVLAEKGERDAATFLKVIGTRGEAARDLAYRLYSICERKGWTQEALAYNSLITAWPEISRLALSSPMPREQRELAL